MKARTFLLFLLVILPLAGKAQLYAGGSFSIVDNAGSSYINIAPEIGYDVTKQWTIAGKLAYYRIEGASEFSLTPYVRYSFFEKNWIRLFADGGVDLFWSDPKLHFGIGITPGIAFKANEHLSFVAKYGFIGYSETPINDVYGISLHSSNLNIGFYYHF